MHLTEDQKAKYRNQMKDITLDKIEQVIGELFGPQDKKQYDPITYDELRGRVLTGYWYMGSGGTMNVRTGSGGALLIIDSFEKKGLPAIIAAQAITVYTDQGPVLLADVTIKRTTSEQY